MALARTSLVRLVPEELLKQDAYLGLQFRAVERGEALRRSLGLLLASNMGHDEKLARILKLLDEGEGSDALEGHAGLLGRTGPPQAASVMESKRAEPAEKEAKEMKWIHLPRCATVKRALE